jgi:membrane protease YdiL (CAAX protease family)
MLAAEFVIALVAVAVALDRSRPLRETLALHNARPSVFVAAAVGTILLGPLGDALMTSLAARFPNIGLGVIVALRDITRVLPLWLLWPTFALLPGIAEELLFRGLLQRAAPRGLRAVLVSGVAFAVFHADPIHMAGVLPLGLYLAWVAERSSTLVTIVAHVANNTFALVASRLASFDVGYGTQHELPMSWLACSLLGVALCAHVVRRGTLGAVG